MCSNHYNVTTIETISKALFTLATEAEAEMETERELETRRSHSSMDQEKDRKQAEDWWKQRRKKRIVSFSSVSCSASVELSLQNSKCEPLLTEAQAETEG